jgi:hypothetical protein
VRGIAFAVVLFVTVVQAAAPLQPSMLLEPARTRVGIASVRLEVSGLTLAEGALVGTYEISVPLLPMLDDRGTVRFDLVGSLDQALAKGSVLTGFGHSVLDNRKHRVDCIFGDEEAVQITVDTGDRILSFHSRWTMATDAPAGA